MNIGKVVSIKIPQAGFDFRPNTREKKEEVMTFAEAILFASYVNSQKQEEDKKPETLSFA